MNISKKILKMVVVIIIIPLLVGCGMSDTPVPTPDHSILASDKRKDTPDQSSVVYTLPEMDQITLANIEYKDGLTMDIYYPLDFDFTQNLPVVIFVNGFGR